MIVLSLPLLGGPVRSKQRVMNQLYYILSLFVSSSHKLINLIFVWYMVFSVIMNVNPVSYVCLVDNDLDILTVGRVVRHVVFRGNSTVL